MESTEDSSLITAIAAMKQRVDAVAVLVSQLKEQLIDKKITAKLAEHLKVFDARLTDFKNACNTGEHVDFDRVSTCASHVGTYATAITQALKPESGDIELTNIKQLLTDAAKQLAAAIEEREITYKPGTPPGGDVSTKIRDLKQRNNALSLECEKYKQTIAANSKKLAELEGRIETLSGHVKEKLNQVDALYDSTLVTDRHIGSIL